MPTSDAQRRATAKYLREKVKTLSVRFYPSEAEIAEWLDAQPNKQGYVKRLIREDMERTRRAGA